jgi:periplasmic protein TonB
VSAHGPRRRDAARWGVCFALALCFHLAGAAALMAHWRKNDDLVVNAPAIMIELAPLPVATRTKPAHLPPGPEQTAAKPQAEPRPVKSADRATLKPEPAKTAELSVTPPPKPAIKPRPKASPRQRARLASAPSNAEQKSLHAAAPAPGAASHNTFALPNWKSALVARLERYKRYPAEAQAHGEQGVVQLAFNVDRQGRVHNARILRSSGSHLLDRATLALIERAQPLPAPPPEIHGAEIAIVVPIRYNIH